MNCGKAQDIVVEELKNFLDFIEYENSNFEKERNELKAQYHGRSSEEKNIVKDVLVMHNEFDKDINKFREIVDGIAEFPSYKCANISSAEALTQDIVSMQAILVQKHSLLQKLLVQKINYQRLQEQCNKKISDLTEETNQMKYKILEYENYEHYNIFTKKCKFLNSEILRLKGIIRQGEEGSLDEYFAPELTSNNFDNLTDNQAKKKLQEIMRENQGIEEEISAANGIIAKEHEYQKNRTLLAEKKGRVNELRQKYKNMTQEIERVKSPSTSADYSMKIRMYDAIIGRKSALPVKPVSPKGRVYRNVSILQDIEASLSRVRSIGSPQPKSLDS